MIRALSSDPTLVDLDDRTRARRTTRQVRLAEVGEDGQARLLATRTVVSGGDLVADVEARYLARAGVTVERREEPSAAASTASDEVVGYRFVDPAARDVARGASRAIAHIVSALERR